MRFNLRPTGRTHGLSFLCMLAALLSFSIPCASRNKEMEKVEPYKGYTGSVHQFGFMGGAYYTANPNYTYVGATRTYRDYGLGAAYTLHDYVTRQFTFDLISSIMLTTSKALEVKGVDESKQKMILPVDCRFYLGPSEDFQVYVGTGVQWTMQNKTTGDYDIIAGSAPSKTIHQLSGNAVVGLNFFGPQKYMAHLTVGAKFHYSIADNDDGSPTDGNTDLSKDRDGVILTGGLTIDVDRRKRACVMLGYEYPLGSAKPDGGGFFARTQTISVGLMFHIGGTR